MICSICQLGEPAEGTTTVTLEKDGSTLVVKGVPALVCPNCGEEYVSDEVSQRLLQAAEKAAQKGATVDVMVYAA